MVPGPGARSGAARAGRVGVGGALAAVLVAAAALAARFGIGEVPPWQAATAISAARLLSPGWPSRTAGADQHELPLIRADLPR